jgi:hypothetical protein
MKEILVNSISNIGYKVYVDGALTDATGDVRVTVYKEDVKVIDNQIATKVSAVTGTYRYLLPTTVEVDGEEISVTTTEGILKATWTFTVGITTLSVTEYYDVVTPYSPWDYFVPVEPNTTPTYQDYLECERVSRFIINSTCGQEFGQEYTTYAVEGHGTNSLALPRRLQALDSVTWTNNPVARPGEVIGWNYPYAWEMIAEGWTLRQQPYANDMSVTNVSTPRFVRNRTYTVAGLWGYRSVPTEIVEASKILTADFMCKEAKYRDKYLDNIKMGDWRLQFVSGAWTGTGNAKVDQLLTDFRLNPGIGLI